jgi:hypothetical protein
VVPEPDSKLPWFFLPGPNLLHSLFLEFQARGITKYHWKKQIIFFDTIMLLNMSSRSLEYYCPSMWKRNLV